VFQVVFHLVLLLRPLLLALVAQHNNHSLVLVAKHNNHSLVLGLLVLSKHLALEGLAPLGEVQGQILRLVAEQVRKYSYIVELPGIEGSIVTSSFVM
jgi:hypothetical protein